MAAEVSSRQMKSDAKNGLITRDFLGVSSDIIESQELDLDLHVPFGWEKRLDLKSGKVYIQRSNPAINTVPNQRTITNQTPSKLQNLTTKNPTLNLLEQPSLDLKLVSNSSPSSYTSVCTLDKVKSALDRAERSSPSSSTSSSRKRWMSPSPSNSSSLSIKETEDEVEKVSLSGTGGLLVAAACPVCFLYVLMSKTDPKCPKCNSIVQLNGIMSTKKPKIDLNIAI
ncbi:hypothetical protein RND81_10G187100 [Saponaria officinalis]|uniref:GIR1-like zinc ribbon domain-containing protein n=1 Tax=Saponaria officinalis TaxID=3572 RepID=A0AAW1I3D8_SAPOF